MTLRDISVLGKVPLGFPGLRTDADLFCEENGQISGSYTLWDAPKETTQDGGNQLDRSRLGSFLIRLASANSRTITIVRNARRLKRQPHQY